jgi:hypothetical protein
MKAMRWCAPGGGGGVAEFERVEAPGGGVPGGRIVARRP